MARIDTATQLCAVIGHPVGHSLSPAIHNAAFAHLDLNFVYLAFEVTDLDGFLRGMRAMPSFRGLSVTIPHKLAVIPFLDAVDPAAKKIGSVNTVIHEENRLLGRSTDGAGTIRAFAEAGVDLTGKRILVLGAGGAVRAVAFAMADAEVKCLTVLGRTRHKVDSLVHDLSITTPVPVAGGDIEHDMGGAMAEHDIIIQGTPVGMAPERVGETCVPAGSLRRDHVIFEMVYRPQNTRLVSDAKAARATVILGREMLLHQAALQFEAWTGVAAPLDVMGRAFDRAVEAS